MVSSYDFERNDNDYITMANVFSFSGNDWTCCAWIKVESTAHAYQGIVAQPDTNKIMAMAMHGNKLGIWDEGWVDGAVIATGTWYFVATTYDSGGTTARLYSGTKESDFTLDNSQGGVAFSGGFDDIGVAYYSASDKAPYDGLLSHVKVFNKTLSIEELKELLVKPESIVSDLVLYYPMLSSDPAQDLSGNGNDGTVTGVPAASKDGPPVFFPDP